MSRGEAFSELSDHLLTSPPPTNLNSIPQDTVSSKSFHDVKSSVS